MHRFIILNAATIASNLLPFLREAITFRLQWRWRNPAAAQLAHPAVQPRYATRATLIHVDGPILSELLSPPVRYG